MIFLTFVSCHKIKTWIIEIKKLENEGKILKDFSSFWDFVRG